jgi:hypothetical protein
MKDNKYAVAYGFIGLFLLAGSIGCSYFSRIAGVQSDDSTYVKATIPASSYTMSKDVVSPNVKAEFKAFFVYTDEKSKQNHFYPSGWMGDTQDLKFSGAYQTNPVLGKTCLRVTYLAKGPKQWAGIYWQNPPNNWGTAKGGYDLRGASALTFWVRGEKGGEKISEFKIGGLTGKNPDSDVAWIGPINLKSDWTQYRIDLSKKDLRYINGGFCFTVLQGDNPKGCTFYLDEMKYE